MGSTVRRAQPRWRLLLAALALACSDGATVDALAGSEAPSEAPAPVPAAKTRDWLRALVGDDLGRAREAVEGITQSGDTRFVSVLIELMRASQLQILHADGRSVYGRALDEITGEHFGDDWGAWLTWYTASDLEPPPGFLTWKGALLGRLDPAFEALLQDGAPTTIRVEEIVWGGVAFDGIPPLDRPKQIDPAEADYLIPDEPVFGLSIDGDHRAYPLRLLDWHEMTNDVVAGVPVSIAYCTLCGAGIAYDGRASDGKSYDFGSSGLLMRSNKLMYDRQTQSLWNQFTGRPVVGPLAATDVKLRKLPVVVAKWSDWLEQHPDTKVLDVNTGHDRPYELGAAYAGYFAAPGLMFPVRLRDDALPAKDLVFGIEVAGQPKAYPIDALSEAQVTHDRVGDASLVLVATRGTITVDGSSVRSGPATYRAGGEVRAYRTDDAGIRFETGPEPATLTDGSGHTWRITEAALIGPGGQRADRLEGHVSYWFGWNTFHPRTLVHHP
jgi:hypothetical protein